MGNGFASQICHSLTIFLNLIESINIFNVKSCGEQGTHKTWEKSSQKPGIIFVAINRRMKMPG